MNPVSQGRSGGIQRGEDWGGEDESGSFLDEEEKIVWQNHKGQDDSGIAGDYRCSQMK